MNQQTSEIIQAIRKACPELMKPTRGCLFTSKYNRNLVLELTHKSTTTGRSNPCKHWHCIILNKGSKNRRAKFPVDSCEIIGHHPNLVHLLRTSFEKGASLNISQLGEVFQIKDGERVYSNIIDLKKSLTDNLETNPELREFVYKLVCK